MRISDWSSDVCSSDLGHCKGQCSRIGTASSRCAVNDQCLHARCNGKVQQRTVLRRADFIDIEFMPVQRDGGETDISQKADRDGRNRRADGTERSEEHTAELQSLMRTSYAVLCLKKKNQKRESKSN